MMTEFCRLDLPFTVKKSPLFINSAGFDHLIISLIGLQGVHNTKCTLYYTVYPLTKVKTIADRKTTTKMALITARGTRNKTF